ncbi:putative gamma-glutamylcyclotransferase CG2811 isoform X1 [Amphiura filiformis]|uniref:putative gamma-glutamylcyclotransferase CG2811 isoform X1 n=1 Tax=Amphiura filiformis TaxID=82378 RepID=UPI003B21541C
MWFAVPRSFHFVLKNKTLNLSILARLSDLRQFVNMTSHLVFVYGTLKRGQPNHEKMTNPDNGQATFIGEARTVEKWPLVIATKFNIPFMLDKPGLGHRVQGEVYSINNTMLEALDKLERHPKVHTRNKIDIEMNPTSRSEDEKTSLDSTVPDEASIGCGEIQSCWCYTYRKYTDEMVDLPCFDVYDAVCNPAHEFTWDTVYSKQMTRDEALAYIVSKTLKE